MLFTGREVRIEKNCVRALDDADRHAWIPLTVGKVGKFRLLLGTNQIRRIPSARPLRERAREREREREREKERGREGERENK